MIEINLIPDVKQELLRAQRMRAIVISSSIITSIVAVGIVVLLLIYVLAFQGVRGLSLDGDIEEKSDKLSKVEDLSKILTIQNQLGSISALNDEKFMSSRIFDVAAAISPTDPKNAVSFSQIVMETQDPTAAEGAEFNGSIQIEGQTSSYDSLEVFKKTIEHTLIQYTVDGENASNGSPEIKSKPLANSISLGEVSYGEDASGTKVLRFTISLKYPIELLSPKSENVSFKLNLDGNVTDSYLGIPRFTERAKDLEDGGEE